MRKYLLGMIIGIGILCGGVALHGVAAPSPVMVWFDSTISDRAMFKFRIESYDRVSIYLENQRTSKGFVTMSIRPCGKGYLHERDRYLIIESAAPKIGASYDVYLEPGHYELELHGGTGHCDVFAYARISRG